MTRRIEFDRRALLIAGGLLAAGVAAYGAAGVFGMARRCSEFGARSEAAAQSARRIGLAYLRVHPEEASETRLMAAIAARSATPDVPAIFRIMDDVVRADFAAGKIVRCDGWILARSEARACALFSLRAAQSA
jgi:hypothetical protein